VAKGVFTHPQSSCHIAKVVLTIRHDSRQIPIASDAQPFHTSRGFLHWRFAYAGPAVRAARHHGAGVRKPSHKRKCPDSRGTSILPSGADVVSLPQQPYLYSITSSARISNEGGTVRPSALAVFMLITSSNLVGCSTGRSEGLVPLRILST
jgi:hypothetical protein